MYVCTYVRTCWSCLGMSICTHLHSRARNSCVTYTDERGARTGHEIETRGHDREERRFLTMEDGEDSAASPPQRTCFVESCTERIRRLATLRKRKQPRGQKSMYKRSQEGKREQEQEKLQRKKARCGESSQSRYKLSSLSCSIQP